MPDVSIILGSKNDQLTMMPATQVFDEFGISWEMKILSAHRTPHHLGNYVAESDAKIFITAAGLAAALPGSVAALTTRPVLGVPLDAGGLGGMDSILAILQMPGGIPVGTMGAVGKHGAKNAALFAIAMLSINNPVLSAALGDYRKKMEQEILQHSGL